MSLSWKTGSGASASIEVQLQLPSVIIDPDRASGEPLHAQHLTIDFTYQEHDTPAVQQRCIDFWEKIKNETRLNGTKVTPNQEAEPVVQAISAAPVYNVPLPLDCCDCNKYPGITAFKHFETAGSPDPAILQSTGCTNCNH